MMNRWYFRTFFVSVCLASLILCLETAQLSAQVRVGPLDYRDYDLDDMGIANPATITFAPNWNLFYIGYALQESRLRIFAVTPYERLVDVFNLDGVSIVPINVAFDSRTKRLLIYDSQSQQLVVLETEPNGTIDSSENIVRYRACGFALLDAQGMVVSDLAADLYILDAATREVVQVQADDGGNYGVAGCAMDRVSRIKLDVPNTASLRGLAFDGKGGHFYTLDTRTKILYQLTTAGRNVMRFDLSKVGMTNPQGVAIAPTADSTDDSSLVDLYITDAGLVHPIHPSLTSSIGEPMPRAASNRWLLRSVMPATSLMCQVPSAQRSGRLIELYLKSLPDSPTVEAPR